LSDSARPLNPSEPPERIYGWLDSLLSIARHYGGLTYQGHSYLIDYKAEGQPLVRSDVIQREVKAQNARNKAQRETAKQTPGGLL